MHPPTPPTGTCTHKHSDFTITKLNLHSLKRAANGDFRWMKTAAWNRKHGRSTVLGKEMFLGYIFECTCGICDIIIGSIGDSGLCCCMANTDWTPTGHLMYFIASWQVSVIFTGSSGFRTDQMPDTILHSYQSYSQVILVSIGVRLTLIQYNICRTCDIYRIS